MDSKVPAGDLVGDMLVVRGGSTFENWAVTSSMILVGGSNPHEKIFKSNWIIFPEIGLNIKKCLKPPPRIYFGTFKVDATTSSCHGGYHD